MKKKHIKYNQSHSVSNGMSVKGKRINQTQSCPVRDKMLVENKIFTTYHRPVRDGIWVKK
jgi:hypothetical protein